MGGRRGAEPPDAFTKTPRLPRDESFFDDRAPRGCREVKSYTSRAPNSRFVENAKRQFEHSGFCRVVCSFCCHPAHFGHRAVEQGRMSEEFRKFFVSSEIQGHETILSFQMCCFFVCETEGPSAVFPLHALQAVEQVQHSGNKTGFLCFFKSSGPGTVLLLEHVTFFGDDHYAGKHVWGGTFGDVTLRVGQVGRDIGLEVPRGVEPPKSWQDLGSESCDVGGLVEADEGNDNMLTREMPNSCHAPWKVFPGEPGQLRSCLKLVPKSLKHCSCGSRDSAPTRQLLADFDLLLFWAD